MSTFAKIRTQQYSSKQPLLRFLLASEYKSRGKTLMFYDRHEEALEKYEIARYHGIDSDLLDNTGWINHTLHNYKDAEIDADLWVQMFPANVKSRQRRASARYALKEYSKGLKDFREIVALTPKYAVGWAGIGYYHFWVDKNFPLAEENYGKAAELDAKTPRYQYYYDWSLIEQHKPQALKEMRKYMKQCDQTTCLLDNQIWVVQWLNCIDQIGVCEMEKADYLEWQGLDKISLLSR